MTYSKIKTAIIKYGDSGSKIFAPFLHNHDGFQLTGAVESKVKKIHEDYDYVKSYNSIDELLNDQTVELVLVNTPTDLHYELAKKVLNAGKNAIVDQIFTNTAEEALDLYKIALSKGLHIFVYQYRSFDNVSLTIEKIIKTGKLGKIIDACISINFYLLEHFKKVFYREILSDGEFDYHCAHVLDQAIKLFDIPEQVLANITTRKGDNFKYYHFEITLFYPNKSVTFRSNHNPTSNESEYMVIGLNGNIVKLAPDIRDEQIVRSGGGNCHYWEKDNKIAILTYNKEGKKLIENVPMGKEGYSKYFEAVYQSIRCNDQYLISAFEAYKTMLVIDAVRKSNEQNCLVYVDSSKQ